MQADALWANSVLKETSNHSTHIFFHFMQKKTSPWLWVPTLYFAEGLPNVLVTGLAAVMYMQMGLSDAELGLYTGWLALPWVVKP